MVVSADTARQGDHSGRSEEKEVKVKDSYASRQQLASRCSFTQRLPALWRSQSATHRVRYMRLVQRSRRSHHRLTYVYLFLYVASRR
jgi:hypothetical protein